MENEIKNLENLKKLTNGFLNTLKSSKDEKELYTAEIKFINYYELGALITNLLKLCILAEDQNRNKVSEVHQNEINVSLVLETVLQLFPMDELELLTKISEKINFDS